MRPPPSSRRGRDQSDHPLSRIFVIQSYTSWSLCSSPHWWYQAITPCGVGHDRNVPSCSANLTVGPLTAPSPQATCQYLLARSVYLSNTNFPHVYSCKNTDRISDLCGTASQFWLKEVPVLNPARTWISHRNSLLQTFLVSCCSHELVPPLSPEQGSSLASPPPCKAQKGCTGCVCRPGPPLVPVLPISHMNSMERLNPTKPTQPLADQARPGPVSSMETQEQVKQSSCPAERREILEKGTQRSTHKRLSGPSQDQPSGRQQQDLGNQVRSH